MKTSGLAIALALGLAGSPSAHSLTLTFLGFGNPTTTAVRYDSSLSWSARSSASYSTLTVGTHRWGVYGQERTSFCTQLFEGVTEGQTYTFDVVDPSMVPEAEDPTTAPGPMGEVKAQLLNDLYRRYYAGLSGAVDTGAFQIAIYEITHENLTAETAADALVDEARYPDAITIYDRLLVTASVADDRLRLSRKLSIARTRQRP